MIPSFSREGRRFEIPSASLPHAEPAVVIGTFAAVPYVHLHLEARKRLYPDVPCLVHDDASPVGEKLQALCREYGVVFSTNTYRFPATLGDVTVFYDGLLWAQEIGANVLVKFSRRLLPITDWRPSLIQLIQQSEYHTYSSWTTSFNFGFRTEAMALWVEDWMGILDEIAYVIGAQKEVFVEGFFHQLAKKLPLRLRSKAFDARIGDRPSDRNGYAPWDWLGTDRRERTGRFLWHDAHGPADYAEIARQWGLPYGITDFQDPNMGYGSRPC